MLQAPQCKQKEGSPGCRYCRETHALVMVVVFGRSRRPSTALGAVLAKYYAKEYEKWSKDETNGGKAGASS